MKTRVFLANGWAKYRFRTCFHEDTFANVTFFDQSKQHIPFHISLRFKEGIVSLNQRNENGWGQEQHHSISLKSLGTNVEITFENKTVDVTVNGQSIFINTSHNGRFHSTDQIAFVEHTGGLIAASIDLETRHFEDRFDQALVLDRRLQICVRPSLVQTLRLRISGLETIPIPPRQAQSQDETAFIDLPGRIWAHEREVVTIDLLAPGNKIVSRKQLNRKYLRDRIVEILAVGDLRGDPCLTASLAEHLKYSGIYRHLPSDALTVLAQAIDANRLNTFWAPPTRHTHPKPANHAAEQDGFGTALSDLSEVLQRRNQDPDTWLRCLNSIDLPEHDSRKLVKSMIEPFCVSGTTQILIDWADIHASGGFDPNEDPWHNSVVLPILLRRGRFDEAIDVLQSLSLTADAQISTPALAWTIQRILVSASLPPEFRNSALSCFSGLLLSRSNSYWSQASCSCMVETSLRILLDLDCIPKEVSTELVSAMIATYGLSAPFWDRVTQTLPRLPTPLRIAKSAYEKVRTAYLAPSDSLAIAEADKALAWLLKHGCKDALQLRREMYGPAGIPLSRPGLPRPDTLCLQAPDPAEAAIRTAAFPVSDIPNSDFADLCVDSISDIVPDIASSPKLLVQRRALERSRALLQKTNQQEALRLLQKDLIALATPETSFSGLAVAMGLAIHTKGHDVQDSVLLMLQKLVLTLASGEREQAFASPATRAALTTLAGEPDLKAKLRGLFPELSSLAPSVPNPLFACPLHNTVLVVFSCRQNLKTGLLNIRNSWLRDATALGIPHVIVVGDGEGRLNGDVLEVDAPDNYEGLPEKMLAVLRWVKEQTNYTHLVKVDDDCFLNVPEFFGDYSYRLSDYYGRPLVRTPGQTNRAWHTQKSTTPRGQMELDKSPEPSVYADGGCGYALSRTAMESVLTNIETPTGRKLRQVSFMEDKLLGDLLSLDGITVNNDNYHVSVRRRMYPNGRQVARWVNSFWPSRSAPIKLVHLDNHQDQSRIEKHRSSRQLLPKKVWPGFQNVKLGFQSNALELISPIDRIEPAMDAHVSIVSTVRNEMFMLPHFLRHYRNLGVESFLIADNGSDDGTLEYLADQPDVALFSVDSDYKSAHYGVAWQQALLSNFRVGKWSLVADADEFLTWQFGGKPKLADLIKDPEFEDADAVRVFMLDMYPRGSLSEVDFVAADPFETACYVDQTPFLTNSPSRGTFSNSRTWTSALRHRLIPGSRPDLFVAQKLALLRYSPWMRLTDGLHFGSGMSVAKRELLFGHFKYNADFHRKVAAEISRGQHFNNAEEYKRYSERLSTGRDTLFDSNLSVHWTKCPFVAARMRHAPPKRLTMSGFSTGIGPSGRSALVEPSQQLS